MNKGCLWSLAFLMTLVTPVLCPATAYIHSRVHAGYSNPLQQYTVKPGGTMWDISQHLHLDVHDLERVNHIHHPKTLQIGQILVYHPAHPTPSHPNHPALHNFSTAAIRRLNSLPHSTSVAWKHRLLQKAGVLFCTVTAYTAGKESTGKTPNDPAYGITSTGNPVTPGVTVAVDPHVIPYGTQLYIPGVGYRIAEDTGSAMVGAHIDVFYNSLHTARAFGVRRVVPVFILRGPSPVPKTHA